MLPKTYLPKFIFITCIFLMQSFIMPDSSMAAPKVFYSIKPARGDLNTEFFVQVSVSSNNFSETSAPEFEETEEMTLQYLSSSVQQQVINGDVSFQKTFLYKLIFNKALPSGEHTLPRGGLMVDGSKYRLPTKKVQIDASSSAPPPQAGTKTGNDPFDPSLHLSGQNFQFIQTVSNERPYIGEQILYKVEIIAPENLERAQLDEFEPQGVWRERYGQDEKKIRTVQNVNINSFSESWFAIQAGEVSIPERTLRAEIREFQKRRKPSFGLGSSLSDQLLGSLIPYFNQFKTVEKTLLAPGLRLQVRPLPPPPQPIKGFIPVGQIKVSSNIDSQSITLGEPLTLTIQVSGDANLRPLEIFDPKDLDKSKIKRYDDKPIISKTIGQSNVTFYKTFKIALIPLEEGFAKIPSFEINWFDPVKSEYQQYLTEPDTVRVIGNGQSEKTTIAQSPKVSVSTPKNIENKKELIDQNYAQDCGKRIPYLKRSSSILFIILSILIILIKYTFNSGVRFFTADRFKKKKLLNKLRDEISQALAEKQPCEKTIPKLKTLLSIKSDIPLAAITSKELPKKLDKLLRQDVIEECSKIFNDYEQSLYSGNLLDSDQTNSRIKEVLAKL